MRTTITNRISPAFALAFVALLVALGGTGYAAATISGKTIKAKSLPGNRVVNNALTGRQINESRLGVVPVSKLAFNADTAKKALTADTASTADSAKTALIADTAKVAEKAADADKLGGRAPAEYLRSARTVRTVTVPNVAANATVELQALCQADELAVGGGGGWYIVGTDTSVASATLSVSVPVAEGALTGWRMEGRNTSPVARDAQVKTVCLTIG